MLKERQDKIMKSERLTMQVNSEFADIFKSTIDSIRARDLDQGEEEEEGEAGKSGLNLINK